MREILKPGQTLTTKLGSPCKVIRYLGSGGQGEVFEAGWSGGTYALKYYYKESATHEQASAIERLTGKGSPSHRFLWPIEMIPWNGETFGYLMPLRELRFHRMTDIVARRIEPSFRSLATIGYRLADSFLELHAKGLCYCDLSWGNVFLDPVKGDIAICDNDNVIPTGEKPAILGTPEFMAPEVVVGAAHPSGDTDKFSLAVLLFYLFYIDHPLKGKKEADIKCFDIHAGNRLFGEDPVYIFDPSDSSNRPVPGIHDNAIAFHKIYPECFRKMLEKSFTAGLRDVHGRVTENEWKQTMARLYDSIFYCSHCSAENFYDPETIRQNGGAPPTCWSCDHSTMLPFRLRIDKSVVLLNHDTALLPHHLGHSKEFVPENPVARVNRHPQDPTVWGLRNESTDKWVATLPNGSTIDVEPGKNVRLATGTRIQFGKVEGEIRY